MNFSQLSEVLRKSDLDVDEYRRLADICRSKMVRTAYDDLAIGTRVSFTHKGRKHFGTVEAKLQKNVKVAVDGSGTWRITPSLLTVEEQPKAAKPKKANSGAEYEVFGDYHDDFSETGSIALNSFASSVWNHEDLDEAISHGLTWLSKHDIPYARLRDWAWEVDFMLPDKPSRNRKIAKATLEEFCRHIWHME